MSVEPNEMLQKEDECIKCEEEEIKEIKEVEECAICYNLLNEDVCNIPCKHKFHNKCVKQMYDDKCPLCRQEMKINIHDLRQFTSDIDLPTFETIQYEPIHYQYHHETIHYQYQYRYQRQY